MKRSWQAECALKRQNQGKKGSVEIENEAQRSRLQQSISALQSLWAERDAAEQDTRTDKDKVMTTEQRAKLRALVHTELRRNHWGNYEKFEIALASVVKAHPEFANAKGELLTEFANEQRGKPTPQAFRAEVLREIKATGLSYNEAFNVVAERYPAMQNQFSFHNESLADSTAAGRELQEALDKYFAEHPALDRRMQSVYQMAFNRVCSEHPEIVARMHVPGKSAVNLWHQQSSDGHTPAKAQRASGHSMPNSPAERAAKA